MKFLTPAKENNFLVGCEKCGAIISFSLEDCYCTKHLDQVEFARGHIQNVTKVSINCPNCNKSQDVAAGFRYVSDDKGWFK